uniref:Uncharacterized protein n=1 Tax=Craspedostauros australis TaxID=1486917 RepID=A0A7R9WR70_9STRA|mmetsp:Transcript_1372/g.3826  ORF Transcript_1372/g.3826 Transcript_1372/m.3826 type:complete len:321 (+) Transcript_1372:207-1169(+)|eukprot:CAMPEP_0198114324 /NCGR_PEP_ID=MMETSP1442-20131203/5741_1 /TAXON_ID= /ORGANISM="Craspedostauros australis, Strain CCMP3328" /LENGTH=320 /DNA_ID=CAMNT_0043771611 /DNA_START=198 /DNA_END=1160 /DNA_ORIENTATION=-
MQIRNTALTALCLATSVAAFAPAARPAFTTSIQDSVGGIQLKNVEDEITYVAGNADTEFARRFGGEAGKEIRTVGEAFADFTELLGFSVNALYKNMVTDLVGTTHLIVVNARFQRDAVWCLGIISTLDLLLKNYPETEIGEKIVDSLFKCVGMEESDVRAEAAKMKEWATGKTRAEIEAALSGEDPSSPLGSIATTIKEDEYWYYSRYFGLGLVSIMDTVGIEMDKDEVYPIMEEWMKERLGRSSLTACNDSDMYFRVKNKLDMMETMMKEIEIREKKRMAERLEDKAEAALRAAEREKQFQAEVQKEKEAKEAEVEETA